MRKNTKAAGEEKGAAKSVWKRLWSYPLRYFRTSLILFFVFVALAVACNALGPRILGLATTKIFTNVMEIADGSRADIDMQYIGNIALVLLILYAAAYFFQYMQGRLMTRITNRSTYHIRNDIVRKLASLPPSYFQHETSAAVLSHITNDADVVAVTFNQVMTQTANSVFTLTAVTFMMFSMSPLVALVVFALLPGSVLAAFLIGRRSHRYFTRLQKRMGALTTRVQAAYDARGARPFSPEETRAFLDANELAYEDAKKGNALSGANLPLVNTMSSAAYVAVCLLGALLIISGRLTIGELQAFIQYVRSFSQPLTQIAWISNSIQSLHASARNIFEFLDEEDSQNVGREVPDRFDITFEDVSFSRGDFALRDLSLHIPEGSVVAITGPEGAGKTTLLKLLLGEIAPDRGRVLVGSADPRRLQASPIFGAAMQTPWLRSETVAENIAYGRPDATDADIREAARRVGADRFIAAQPEGLNARVGERLANLSGGEIQLLQAARLECSNPRVFVLDNAFDSLDALTFRKLLDLFMRGHPGATRILVTDDLSELAAADMAVMLKNGRIEASGAHADLLVSNPLYAEYIKGLAEPEPEE